MLEMFSEFGGWPLIDDSWDDSKSDGIWSPSICQERNET